MGQLRGKLPKSFVRAGVNKRQPENGYRISQTI